MLAKLLLMGALLLLLPFSLFAKELRLSNTFGVKVLRAHQFRAIFIDESGSQIDVSAEANFSASGAQRSGVPGRFTFNLPSFGSSTSGYETLEVTYSDNGTLYRDRQSVRIDYTPDSIFMSGITSVRSGGSAFLRARGSFGGHSVDLTSRGRWSASYGTVYNGNYRAPRLRPNQSSLMDRVSFSFGLRSDSATIYVRP